MCVQWRRGSRAPAKIAMSAFYGDVLELKLTIKRVFINLNFYFRISLWTYACRGVLLVRWRNYRESSNARKKILVDEFSTRLGFQHPSRSYCRQLPHPSKFSQGLSVPIFRLMISRHSSCHSQILIVLDERKISRAGGPKYQLKVWFYLVSQKF